MENLGAGKYFQETVLLLVQPGKKNQHITFVKIVFRSWVSDSATESAFYKINTSQDVMLSKEIVLWMLAMEETSWIH